MKQKFYLRNPDQNKWYIATAVGCFFGLAFVFLIKFTVQDFKKDIKRNNAILYSGIGALIFSLSYVFCLFATGFLVPEFIYIFVVRQAVMAVYLFIVYAVHIRCTHRWSRCFSLVQNDHITSLDELGNILCLNEKQIEKCVTHLINAGYLEGAFIDKEKREIVFSKSIWANQRIICENCGAELIINYGHTLICEYCGQALPVKRN